MPPRSPTIVVSAVLTVEALSADRAVAAIIAAYTRRTSRCVRENGAVSIFVPYNQGVSRCRIGATCRRGRCGTYCGAVTREAEREIRWASVSAPFGAILVGATGSAVVSVLFPGDARSVDIDDEPHGVLADATRQLSEYFAGTRTVFDVPVDAQGTEFQRTAWTVLSGIGHAETISYAEQARLMGRPSAVRAVGAANGRNPVPVIVPCHRVVGADGSLTGFAGGVATKAWLLEHERRVASAIGAA